MRDLWCHMSLEWLGGINTCGPRRQVPGSVAAVRHCDWHKVSTHGWGIPYQILSLLQETMIIPSGCFPFVRCNLEGSNQEGILQLWGHVGWYCCDVIVSPCWIDSLTGQCHYHSVNIGVSLSKRSSHSLTHGNPDDLITHSQSKVGNWWDIQPCPRLRWVSSQQPASGLNITAWCEDGVRLDVNPWTVLGLLATWWSGYRHLRW